ncbi:MAG: nucleotide sugar dehydrogenase [Candidatus Methanofastidiosa archaeon]|nr:nucleotide sugar dehydrogenase [Candidatus Methanofastidiosa archaeon]
MVTRNNTTAVAIVGVGYVGLPLAICFSQSYRVVAYDVSQEKIASLLAASSYVDDVTNADIAAVLGKTLFPSSTPSDIASCDYVLIAVPTPITKDRKPDLAPVISATRTVASVLRPGQTVVLESTTYPGTVEEVMKPILESTGLVAGTDFHLAYSPERIDPGNKTHTVYNTPKVVGGESDEVTESVRALYQSVIDAQVVTVSSIKTAEATKIFENVFRAVNIALVNELSIVFEHMGINTWEVIEAASTKPMGFLAHYPGIGVGGHCIPVDPYYLSYKARKIGHMTRFIELAGEINRYMPLHTAYATVAMLARIGKRPEEASVAILGVTYKPDTCDTRDSPSFDLIAHLLPKVGAVRYYDPHVPTITIEDRTLRSCSSLDEALASDCVVVAVAHASFKDAGIEERAHRASTGSFVDGKRLLHPALLGAIPYRGLGTGVSV